MTDVKAADGITRPDDSDLDAAFKDAMHQLGGGDELAEPEGDAKGDDKVDAEALSNERGPPAGTEGTEKGEDVPVIDAVSAPEHWPVEQKSAFSEVSDPAARKLVLEIDKKLQAAHTRRSQEHAEEVRLAESIRRVFEPHKNHLKISGMDEVRAVEAMIAERAQWMAALQSDPKQFIEGLARQYQVTLGQADDQEEEFKDPYVKQLEAKLGDVEGRLQQMATSFQHQSIGEAKAALDQFRSAKNEDGSEKHPYFEQLKSKMSAFLVSGQANNYDEAYQMALWADGDLRQREIERETTARLKKQEDARKADIDKARKASRHLSGLGPARAIPKTIDSIDDAFAAAMAQLSASAT